MHQQTKLIFLFLFLWMVQKTQGQDNGKRAENTILKIDKDQSPFSTSQANWLVKNGFKASNYDWSNLTINKQLNESLRRHRGAQYFGIIAGASALLVGQKQIANGEGGFGYLMLSVTSGLISINKMNKSKRQVRQIEKWRASLISNSADTSLILNNDNKTEFSLISPYKSSKNKYLSQKGFSIHDYDWKDAEINLQLKKAINNRKEGHVLLALAVPTTLIGLVANLAYALSEDDADKSDRMPGTGFFIASGVMVTGSLIFTNIARGKVKKAEQLRKYPKPKSPQ